MSICFVCEKDQAVKDNMCGICLCYRFGMKAIETEEQRELEDRTFERRVTYGAIGFVLLVIAGVEIWMKYW